MSESENDGKARLELAFCDFRYAGIYVEDGLANNRLRYRREQGDYFLAFFHHAKDNTWKWGISKGGYDTVKYFVKVSGADALSVRCYCSATLVIDCLTCM